MQNSLKENKEIICNLRQEIFKVINLNNIRFDEGTIARRQTPIKGNINIHNNKFLILIIIFCLILFLNNKF